MKFGVKKLLRTGLVAARAWRGQAVRKQMAAAAGKESVSLSMYLEVHDLEVEEELSTVATLAWAGGTWLWNGLQSRKKRGESRDVVASERTCRRCSARDP